MLSLYGKSASLHRVIQTNRQQTPEVVALGIQTSQEDFIEAAVETNAGAIIISSMSGHARLLCEGLLEKCVEAGLKDIVLYLGRTLSTGDTPCEELEQMFLKMGCARVYPSTAMPGQIMEDLKADIAATY